MVERSSSPGRTGYLIALILFVLGIIGAIALLVVFYFGVTGVADDLHRVVVPGSEEVELTETGTYTIFYEYESTFRGQEYARDSSRPDLNIQIRRLSDGEEIELNRSFGSTTYDLRDYAGESIRSFEIDEPGVYEISAEYADGRDGPEIVLALGEGIGWGILMSVGAFLGAGALFCFLSLVAIIVAGITLYRRSRGEQSSSVQT